MPRLVALLGDPVAHSRSPALHNAAFRALGLDLLYLPFRVPPVRLGAALDGLRALGAVGANLTLPHKEAALPYLDALTPAARAIGAVNTLVISDDGRIEGDNTDAGGFLDGLSPYVARLDGAEAVVFGAGGATRAVVYALLTRLSPARLTLASRTPERAIRLAEAFEALDTGRALAVASGDEVREAMRRARLVVNATPLGMPPQAHLTPYPHPEDFGPQLVVYDLIYTPAETRLMREAAARGAVTIGGLPMLAGQAARAFERWTGRTMPPSVLEAWTADVRG
ncbi:MAG TPA: shikimate dehydrogenase [Rhodothermales bacterium]|nr:shikimate dehydrogenase [Rhodothermales bacterium]